MKKALWMILIGILIASPEAWGQFYYAGGGTSADATESVKGISERCTDAEMTAGTKTDCDVTPANAKVELDKKQATITYSGSPVEGDILAKGASDGVLAKATTLEVATVNLPSSDADPGTTAGQIKHDSTDTDASAGGIVEWWDGTNTRRMIDGSASAAVNYTVIVKTEFIPIAWMTDGAAAPAAIATYETLKYRDFDDAATKDAQFIWVTPLDLIGTTIKVRAIAMVSNATAPADEEGVSWGISAGSVAASASVDVARGAVAVSEDTDLDNDCNAQYDACYFPYAEVTPAVTVTPGNLMAFTVNRIHDDADDTYAQDIGLIGVEIKYKARINLVDTW